MTRWDLLKDLMSSKERRDAIGKAWPLFMFLVFHMNRANKFVTNYPELSQRLAESPNTIKHWRDRLVVQKIANVRKGNCSMAFCMLPPYDSLVTCEKDDLEQIKIKSDSGTRRVLDRAPAYDIRDLLPIMAEIMAKVERLEKGQQSSAKFDSTHRPN